jgi:hypothetical protein
MAAGHTLERGNLLAKRADFLTVATHRSGAESGIERDSAAKNPIQTAPTDQCCPRSRVRLMLRQIF